MNVFGLDVKLNFWKQKGISVPLRSYVYDIRNTVLLMELFQIENSYSRIGSNNLF